QKARVKCIVAYYSKVSNGSSGKDAMTLRIYNSLSRRKEVFPPQASKVRMFVCGPTVYDYAHLGHARTYIAFDIIARYMKYLGYSVNYLMNITDVADRIFDRAKTLNRNPNDLARQYEQAFKEDMQALHINTIQRYARASDHIHQMISQIKRMIEKGVAYETETGVYFEISKFPQFGALSQLNREELSLRRFELCSTKKNPEDFSVWRKQDSGPAWDSPWGRGRPGWHVEDTAITMGLFGDTYDLHGGASELMFPHHEAEIAQAEALTGKSPFVKYWLHTGLLTIGGRKMSKSLGNVVRIRDALKEYSAQELRWYFASFHYREPVSMTTSALKKARDELRSLSKNIETFRKNSDGQETTRNRHLNQLTIRLENNFRKRMDDDFDTPHALKTFSDYAAHISDLGKNQKVDARSMRSAEAAVQRISNVIGVSF
ncbi:MAG TPA: cysteine--tRNA ligase, partial [Candidatus Bathyarchaeia archaeon]|nr:cysteine--tRNA ligase [Candidatus Bathyarchaeia archaeon]